MRPEILFPLFADVTTIGGLGEKSAKLLQNLGIGKVIDLIWHLPAGLIDRTYTPKLAEARTGVIATVKVRVVEHIAPARKAQPYKVLVEDDTDQMTISFFKAYPESIRKNLPVGEMPLPLFGLHKVPAGEVAGAVVETDPVEAARLHRPDGGFQLICMDAERTVRRIFFPVERTRQACDDHLIDNGYRFPIARTES